MTWLASRSAEIRCKERPRLSPPPPIGLQWPSASHGFFFERAARLRPDGATRILVVDDVPQNVELLTARLEDENYVVSKAYDGFQALGKTKSEKPDLIVLDVMMPRIDGFETCRRIKADPASAHIPVIW
jgi:PleD family two-component response regulator